MPTLNQDKNGLEELLKSCTELMDPATLAITATKEDLNAKSIKELKEMLKSRSISMAGLAEKGDLVDRLLQWAGKK